MAAKIKVVANAVRGAGRAAQALTRTVIIRRATWRAAMAGTVGLALLAGAGLGYLYVQHHREYVESTAAAAAAELSRCARTEGCDVKRALAEIGSLGDDVKKAITEKLLNDPNLSGQTAVNLANCVGGFDCSKVARQTSAGGAPVAQGDTTSKGGNASSGGGTDGSVTSKSTTDPSAGANTTGGTGSDSTAGSTAESSTGSNTAGGTGGDSTAGSTAASGSGTNTSGRTAGGAAPSSPPASSSGANPSRAGPGNVATNSNTAGSPAGSNAGGAAAGASGPDCAAALKALANVKANYAAEELFLRGALDQQMASAGATNEKITRLQKLSLTEELRQILSLQDVYVVPPKVGLFASGLVPLVQKLQKNVADAQDAANKACGIHIQQDPTQPAEAQNPGDTSHDCDSALKALEEAALSYGTEEVFLREALDDQLRGLGMDGMDRLIARLDRGSLRDALTFLTYGQGDSPESRHITRFAYGLLNLAQALEKNVTNARAAVDKACGKPPQTQTAATTPTQCTLRSYVDSYSWYSNPMVVPGSKCPPGHVFELCKWRPDPNVPFGATHPAATVGCTPTTKVNRACWTDQACTKVNPADCPTDPNCSCTQSDGPAPSIATLINLAPSLSADGKTPASYGPCKEGDPGCVCTGTPPQQIVSSNKLGDPLPPSGGWSGGASSGGSSSGASSGGSRGGMASGGSSGTASSGWSGGTASGGSTSVASAGSQSSAPMPTGPGASANICSPTMPSQTTKQQSPGSPMPPPASTSSSGTTSTSSHGDMGPTSPQSPASAAAPGTEGTVINSGICAGEGAAQKCTQVTKYCSGEGTAQQCTQTTEYCSGGTCTTTPQPGFPPAPGSQASPPQPNAGPLKLKPNPSTQMASAGSQNQNNQVSSVQACESKPPFLPWGGTGSATITVTGGKPCGIGWHDTGATILDSMTVISPPSHGTLSPKDQHVIIFTPAASYKGQDSFTLSMQEHNGGRRATLRVNVSVTIQ